MHQLL